MITDTDQLQGHTGVCFDTDLIVRYGGRGPRYTSYPTAAQFSADFPVANFVAQQRSQPTSIQPLSLYVHVPFCRHACWYCGCNTGVAANDRLKRYEKALLAEIAMVASLMKGRVIAMQGGFSYQSSVFSASCYALTAKHGHLGSAFFHTRVN